MKATAIWVSFFFPLLFAKDMLQNWTIMGIFQKGAQFTRACIAYFVVLDHIIFSLEAIVLLKVTT